MPPARATHELLRVLHDAAQPVYLVDDDCRIVFLNAACADWIDSPPELLIGRQCRWQSNNSDPLAAAADALCPPPEAFQGKRTAGYVCKPSSDGRSRRTAEFVPLRGDSGNWIGVLAIVASTDLPPDASPVELNGALLADEARQLHNCVAQLRQELAHWHHVERLAGASAAMKRVRSQVELAAAGRGTVLLLGPPGSGRQHVARTIHFAQQPPLGTLSRWTCSALPPEALRSTIASLITRHSQPESNAKVTLHVERRALIAAGTAARRSALVGVPAQKYSLHGNCRGATGIARLQRRLPRRTGPGPEHVGHRIAPAGRAARRYSPLGPNATGGFQCRRRQAIARLYARSTRSAGGLRLARTN